MKQIILVLFVFTFYKIDSSAQIISQFNWNNSSNAPTVADVGPNASSISSSATISAGGAGGTNGLNAGLPKRDLDMIIPNTGGVFDVDGIHIEFDYQREESSGTFVSRGNSLSINGTSNLSVSYRVSDGSGGYNTVNSGNQYSIPNDDTFRNYIFYYSAEFGYGALLVNNTEVWNNDGPDNRPMYWTGAGDFRVGFGLDGSGQNNAFLDNLIIAEIDQGPLPIALAGFSVELLEGKAAISWQTTSEINNNFFAVERSSDSQEWVQLGLIPGAGTSNVSNDYRYQDHQPLIGYNYYRLKQVDFDGTYAYSTVKFVDNSKVAEQEPPQIYFDRTQGLINILHTAVQPTKISITNMLGNPMHQFELLANYDEFVQVDVSQLDHGVYILTVAETVFKFIIQ